MKIEDFAELYQLIGEGIGSLETRKQSYLLRQASLSRVDGIVKVAFDTRRVDQELDYIPRRGLQNYHRSEQFISEAAAAKVVNFVKVKHVLDELKGQYEREPEWQDSYCRVLLNTIDQALRTKQGDADFGDTQPSIGSFDYVEELLHTRYRLDMNNIAKYGNDQLKTIILSKDEPLIYKDQIPKFEITKRDVASQSYDTLMDKLFGGIKASAEHPEVERSITIVVKDKFVG